MSSASKQWKENPPGREQRELERLFENGLIDDTDSPNKIRQANPMFMTFSPRVFAVHFRKTKAMCGGYVKNVDRHEDEECEIPELGLSSSFPGPSPSRSTASSFNYKLDSGIHFKNAPYITWVYSDHNKNCDFVCVAVATISGSRDINFSLSEDGTKLCVNYIWPSALYSAQELFHEKLNKADPISMDHPKIHAFASRLWECDLTPNSNPQGSMIISLPTKVKRELGTWSKSGIKSNDTKIVMLEFQAYQKKQIVDDADTSINFD